MRNRSGQDSLLASNCRFPVFRRQLPIVGAAALGLWLNAGLAVASIPDASGVFHGCYKKSDSSLRIIDNAVDSCNKNETEVNWSERGPAGPAGATGQTGPTGAAGPSDAYVKDQKGSFGAVGISTTSLTPILTLSALPPGSYLLFASAAISGPTTETITSCVLTANGAPTSVSIQATTPASAGFTFAAIPLNTSITLASATDISIACRTTSANVISQPSVITAIKVGALH